MKKQQVKDPPKELTLQEKTERFFKIVEAGDIVLFDILPYAIAMFGYTRAGKTTSCHLLCRSPLRAENKNGELIFVPSTKKFDTAVVGTTHNSETQIPNIFEAMVKDGGGVKNIHILDQPGYGDTYGFHRIFSNGYFHYRTFSKTPNLKFVLAVWRNDLSGTAQKFKSTIRNFINTFKNWDEVKKDVLKATALLITRTQPTTTESILIDVIKPLRDVQNMGTVQKTRYQQFLDNMVEQKKIFFISKPTQVNQKIQDTTTLQKIYDKTQFWERKLNGNIVDMSPIKFSVSNQILLKLKDKNDDYFRQEFDSYMNFSQERLDNIINLHRGSLQNIVRLLQIDAKSSNDSHQFLEAMQDFNKKYYNFIQDFSKKREITIVNLFKNLENDKLNQTGDSQNNQAKSIYFIKKFKVLQYLFETPKVFQEFTWTNQRTIEKLEEYSYNFLQIFKKFSILGINKNDRENIIYRYSYIVQRLIEESKILTLIMFTNQAQREGFEKQDVKILQDIFRLIQDRFLTPVLGEINIDQLKLQFIQNIDFSTLATVNEEIINFLESMPLKTKEIDFKIAELIILFEHNLFKDEANPQNENKKKYILKKLFIWRRNFFALWQNLKIQGSVQMRQKCSDTIINLTKSMAHVLENMNLFNEARECYKSLNDANSIFRIYDQQCKEASKDPVAYRKILIKYANDANTYYRKQKALQCCQKAYSLSSSNAQIKEISSMIVSLCTQRKEDVQNDPYLSRLFNFQQKFFEDIDSTVKATIEMECDINDLQ